MKRVLVALLFFWYIYTNLVQAWPGMGDSPSDFGHHYRAAGHIVAGTSPFIDPGYDYPPLISFLVTPLTGASYVTARKIWFVLSHLFLLIAAWLTWRASGRTSIAACCVAAVWALGDAALENLLLGQLGPLLALLLAIAYTSGPITGVLAIGIGFGLKFLPGALAIPLCMARNRRALLALAAVSASSVAIPWAIVTCCLDGPKSPPSAHYWMGTPAVLSWSLPSTALRMLDPPSHGADMPENWLRGNDPVSLVLPAAHRLASVAIAATTVLCGVLVLGLACRWNLDRQQLPWAMAAMTSLVLAAAPICWTHYQVMQYPGVALLLAAFVQHRRWALTGFTLGFGALLYPVPVAVLRSYYERYGAWTAASPATLYFWTSVTPMACLGLFVLLLVQVKARRDIRVT